MGHWLDEKLGVSPFLTLSLGIGAMAATIWRMIDLGKQEEAERREEKDRGDQA